MVKYTWSLGGADWSEPTSLPRLLNQMVHLDDEDANRTVFVAPLNLADDVSSLVPLEFCNAAEAVQHIRECKLPVAKFRAKEDEHGEMVRYMWSYGDINAIANLNPVRWSKYHTLPLLLNEIFQKTSGDLAKRPVHVKNEFTGDWRFDSFEQAVECVCTGRLPLVPPKKLVSSDTMEMKWMP